MLNDVTSNEEIVFGELELRDALLKFRGPGTGDSEEERRGEKIEDEVREGSMMSVSEEKDGLFPLDGFRRPFCSNNWYARSLSI